MNQEEKNKYIRGVVGSGIFLAGFLFTLFYLLYSDYRYEHYGKLTTGRIVDKNDISGSVNTGYTISYLANMTAQEIYFQSGENHEIGDSVRIYYLPDDPRSIEFADAPQNDVAIAVLFVPICGFGLIFVLLLCFPQTMMVYFKSIFR